MTKLFKNSKSVLSLVLAFAVLAVSLFTGVVINSDAATCVDDLSQLNVVYANNGIGQTAPTRGTGTETDPFIIENPSHLRYIAQKSTPETTYGKYYKVDDSVDIMVFQSEAYINAVAGSLEAFLALDAEGVKTALSNETNRIQYQSGTSGSADKTIKNYEYDSFAGNIDFNGVTICGVYTANGGLIAIANGGATFKNLTLCNNYYTSGWYNGNLVGFVHHGTASTTEYKPLTISNIVIHDCYQTTSGNGYGNTGVLIGTGVNSSKIPFYISNILTYDNISLGQVSGSDTTMVNCALYGTLPSSWNGEADGVANAGYSNIVTLDCVPYPTSSINNQCTKPVFWNNVYTTMLDAQNRPPCTFNNKESDWPLYDITKIDSADLALGAAAKTNMPELDWTNVWVAVDGKYPELQVMHDFKAVDNGNGTHTTACQECPLQLGTVPHNFADGVCACDYEAKCGEVIAFWDGSADAALADNGEAGTPENPIIIDTAAELNYLVNNVTGASAAGKLCYKMADGIDKLILQPESIATVDADANGIYDILEIADGEEAKAYFESITPVNWLTTNSERWFAGTFDGNNTEFVGMYAVGCSTGLFPTADGGATFKNLAVTNSYIAGVKTSPILEQNGSQKTNGNCRTGAIVGGTPGIGYGAKVGGTVTFENIIVANNNLTTERNTGSAAIIMGSDNTEEAVSINNAIVYGNNTFVGEAPTTTFFLTNGAGTCYAATANTVPTAAPSIKNTIVLGAAPYSNQIKAAEFFANVYTDADTTNYAEANIKSVAGLVGVELKDACAALDWTNTFLATADMPTFRALHDAEFEATYDDETHSLTCSCGLAVEAEAHDWSNKDGVCAAGCGYECLHGDGETVVSTEKTPADCTNAAWYYDECTVCGLNTEEMEDGLYQDGEPLGHEMELVEGTPAQCGVAGVKDYYDCVRCDYVSEDEAGDVAIENLDEWKVIPALDHTPATDDNGTVYGWDDTTPGMHYTVCDRCGENYDGTTCTGEYVFDDEGHEGECTVCGIATEGKEAHSNFDENHKCGTCDWVCTHAEYVDDGEPVEIDFMDKTAEACKTQATKCAVCGTAGEDRIIGHVAGDWSVKMFGDEAYSPSCAGDGSHTEIQTCTECMFEIATRPVTDPKTGHAFDEFEASDPNCVWDGNIAYKYCPNCNYSFALDAADDEPYENALTDEERLIPADPEAHVWVEYAAGDADCENDGYSADHKFCSACYLFVVDGEVTDIVIDDEKFNEREYADENDWVGTPVGIGAIADAYASELYDELLKQYAADNGYELPEEPAEDADWEEWAAYEEEYYGILDELDMDAFNEEWLPIYESIMNEAYHQYFLAEAEAADLIEVEAATGHNLVKVDEVAATYDKDGVKAHWACEDCDKLFADEDGTEEVTEEDLVIAKLVKEEEDKKDDTTTEDKKEDDKTSTDAAGDKEEDKAEGDSSTTSPATGETVATVAAAVAAVIAAGFVLVRKARKA